MAAIGQERKAMSEKVGVQPEALRGLDPACALRLRTPDDFAAFIDQARCKS